MILVKPIDLSGATAPAITFSDKHSLAAGTCCTNYDDAYIEVSNDSGLTWTSISYERGTVSSWSQEVLDLTPYKATPVLIRFRLWDYGDSAESWGWLVDDVQILDLANSQIYFSENFEGSTSTPDFSDLTLTATPNAGNTFVGWTGCNSIKWEPVR